jgi:hypothetical protein
VRDRTQQRQRVREQSGLPGRIVRGRALANQPRELADLAPED